MHRARAPFVLPATLVAVLSAVSGCSGGGGTAAPVASPSPSGLVHYAPATGSAAPAASPSPTAPKECVRTAGMSVEQLTGYLKELRSTSGDYQTKGLTLDSSGLNFTPEDIKRPCEAVTVKLTHYWVDLKKTREANAVNGARYEYAYTQIGTASHAAGPQDGRVPDTAPPGSSACRGTVSVAHLGEEPPLRSLPYDLKLMDTPAPVPVTVSGDGVLSAIYVSPPHPESC
ncbi:hypothetical protein EF912_32030 [Streptomyces sp. WAC07061]|uniref:hypothetical protein n=1 Tax=Streptomyces sp. WAC07061 TaxID=2487410 RepID=UPI000F7A2438|nr:hypothetical protein [Streptomyces sp. WAC07061]RSS40769.1 hypothetical protein EF912_32030 [Streptomyces sp. WAC07061]